MEWERRCKKVPGSESGQRRLGVGVGGILKNKNKNKTRAKVFLEFRKVAQQLKDGRAAPRQGPNTSQGAPTVCRDPVPGAKERNGRCRLTLDEGDMIPFPTILKTVINAHNGSAGEAALDSGIGGD